MIVPSKSVFTTALSVALVSAVVNGHGYMSDPAVTFLSSAGDPTQFIATIEASSTGWDGSFNGAPADNTAAFTTAFEASEYTSLKDVIDNLATITVDGASLTCGSCDPDEDAQPLPETYVEWSHSDSEGFTASHEGPCEVWCDDVRVFQDDDCAADYTTAPAEMPYDRDACLGASTLTFYWLALHSSTWQVYINCAPLEETTSTGAVSSYAVSGSSSSTSTSTNSTTPATTTATPTATTATPTATTAAPAATTAAPAATTAAPAVSTEGSGSEDCGSLDMAESESDCGSLDMAESESDCGSLDMAASEAAAEASSTPSTATKGSTDDSTSTQQSSTTTSSSEVAGDSDTEADVTTDDSECGSLDMAEEDDSECGSLDMAEDDSECGSLEMAESDEADRDYSGSTSDIDFSTFQGNSAQGTVAPEQE